MTTPSPDEAAKTLRQLTADRAHLDAAAPTPWWAPALLGLVAGAWVATPALGDRRAGYVVALVAAVFVVDLARRHMGVRMRASGAARSWAVGVLWLLLVLVMYSVALGLVSLELSGWVAAPALVVAVVTYLLARQWDRWAREALRA